MLDHTFAPKERTKFSATAIAMVAASGLMFSIPAGATEPATSPQATKPMAPAASPAVEAPAATPAVPGGAEQADRKDAPADAALIGLPVLSSDGKTVGAVEKVVTAEDGKVQEMIVETGGFFGFGAKRIAVPVDKITTGGNSVRVALTAADFGRLPEVATTGQG